MPTPEHENPVGADGPPNAPAPGKAAAWAAFADPLADWALRRLVNRADAGGAYRAIPERGRKYRAQDGTEKELGRSFTAKRRHDQNPLCREALARHFRAGLLPERAAPHDWHLYAPACVLGAHAIAPGNTCKWGAADIDAHDADGTADPSRNWQAALCWYERARGLGFRPLLLDSNGRGGYHLWVLFAAPVPSEQCFYFLRWLLRDAAELGVPKAEQFPKQSVLTEHVRFGNWLRLPGRHHTREHWARVWDGTRWLAGAACCEYLLAHDGDDPARIPADVAALAKRAGASRRLPWHDLPRPILEVPDRGRLFVRCLKCLAKIPDSVSGNRGHNMLWRAARTIAVDFGCFTREEAWQLLCWFNEHKSTPVWSDGELLHKLDDAYAKPADPTRVGCMLRPRPCGGDTGNGHVSGAPKHSKAARPDAASATDKKPDAPPSGNGNAEGEPPPPGAGGGPPPPGPPERPVVEGPMDPHRLARLYLEPHRQEGTLALRFWRNEFHLWDGRKYRPLDADEMRARVTTAVKEEFNRINGEQLAAWDPTDENSSPPAALQVTRPLISNVLQATSGYCVLPGAVDQPSWLDGDGPAPASELLVAENLVAHLPALVAGSADCTYPLTPRFFTANALDYPFDLRCPAPTGWLDFLRQLWADDTQSVATLQEWFGYLLTQDTTQQKILMMLGPRRAGKGTIARVLTGLVGPANVCNPTLGGLATNFGLQPLLGKTVAVVSDARLSGRTDAAVVTERLLSISGEDQITVDRKYLPGVTGKLPTRFVIITNELPRLSDASGALAGRLILLRFTKSFYGKEDTRLTNKLLAERPGILLWAIEGWRRLRERGRFVQPDASAELMQDMEDLSSPMSAFVRDCCEVGPKRSVAVDDLYKRWVWWCEQQGRKEPGTKQTFARDLRAHLPDVTLRRPRDGDARVRKYEGIDLKDAGPTGD